MNEVKFSWLNADPDFSSSLWVSIETKLGRKLSPEENERIYRMGAMRKEWFFNCMETYTPVQVERLLATCHLSFGS